MPSKSAFLTDLHTRIAAHAQATRTTFGQLDVAALSWRPDAQTWSILHCFDHLNQTHVYYQTKIAQVMAAPVLVREGRDAYRASLWGGIYMFFALNPRFSFPTPEAIAPAAVPTPAALDLYLQKQDELRVTLDQVGPVDLVHTRVPIEKSVRFNLGDCLKILVYHDGLHIRQAHGVLAQQKAAGRT